MDETITTPATEERTEGTPEQVENVDLVNTNGAATSPTPKPIPKKAPTKPVTTPKPVKKPVPTPTPAKASKAKVKAAKAGAATATSPKTEKDGLRKPQQRILVALLKARTPLSRGVLAEKAGVDTAWMTSWVGSADPAVRAQNDKKLFPSLVGLGLVKQVEDDQDGKIVIVHSLTAAGKKAAEKANA